MASPKIPTINFCKKDLKPGTSQWETTKNEVFKAMQEYGCFEAIYDKISNETREAVFGTLKQVLPIKEKIDEYGTKPYHIYEGQYPHFPTYYPIHSVDVLLPASIETFATTFWPADGNPHFCNEAHSFSKALEELDEMVKRMVLESLGLEGHIDEFLELSSFTNFRLTQYMKAAEGEADRGKFDDHTDISFLTIIKQDKVGLQVFTKNGERIEADVSPNSYIVLFSDSFMAWTNGQLQSSLHTVVVDKYTDRISIILFSLPKLGHIVEAPKELVDGDHPLRFKPYDLADYFKYYMSEARDGFSLQKWSSFWA